MRRTKWDTSGPDIAVADSSTSNSFPSSTNIEAVKALAKKRLEQLMAEKKNTSDSNGSLNMTCNNASTHPNINTLIAKASAVLQEEASHAKAVSDSVQKAAAIAAAFQSGPKSSYLDNLPQIPPGMKLPTKLDKTSGETITNGSVSQNVSNFGNLLLPQPGCSVFPPQAIFGSPIMPFNNNTFNPSIYQFPNGVQNVQAHQLPPFLVPPVIGSSNNASLVNNIVANSKGYSPYLKYNNCIDKNGSNDKNDDVSDDDYDDDDDDIEDDNKQIVDKAKKSVSSLEEASDNPKHALLKHIFGVLPEEDDEPMFNHEIEESANGMFTTDIDINFSNSRSRLVRKEALQEIRLFTGAAVLCRGKVKTNPNSSDKGLYLRITGDTKEKVKDAALVIEKLMVEDVQKVNLRNEFNDKFVDFFSKQKVELKEHLDYIMKISKTYIEIRGTGSNHPEDANIQEQVGLHFIIYGLTESSRNKSESLLKKLIDYVNKQFDEELKNSKQMQFPQQQIGATFSGQQNYSNQQQCSPQNMFSNNFFASSSSTPQYNPYGYNNMTIYNNSLISPNNISPYMINPLLMNQRQFLNMSIPSSISPIGRPVNFGLTWKDLLADEQEQSRRRKEMEEKKKKREQEKEDGRKRLKCTSSSSHSPRSRSPSEEKRSSKQKSFNFVPPPSELCTTNISSTNTDENTNNQKMEETQINNEQISSPVKKPNPSSKSERINDISVKNSNIIESENDKECMPPPPPLNFLKKNKSDSDDVHSLSKVVEENFSTTSVNSTEENNYNSDQKNQQSVALVAYEDDSEED